MDNFGGMNNMDRFGPSGMGRMNGKWIDFFGGVLCRLKLDSLTDLPVFQTWTELVDNLTVSLVAMRWPCLAITLESLLIEEWVGTMSIAHDARMYSVFSKMSARCTHTLSQFVPSVL